MTSAPMDTPAQPPVPEELIPTRDSLLSRIKNHEDHESWRDFFNTYWRLVYGVALKSGLTDQEAQEVVQETVITVARRIPEFKYNPAKCSFKTWLLNLTRWRITDQIRKRRPEILAGARPADSTRTDLMDRLPGPAAAGFDTVWDAEWRQYILAAATERVKRRVRPEQYQIFHCVVFKQWPLSRVTRELGVNRAQIYLAKHRVSTALRKEIKALEKKLV